MKKYFGLFFICLLSINIEGCLSKPTIEKTYTIHKYLSDFDPVQATAEWIGVQRDRITEEMPLIIQDVVYKKGLLSHAPATIIYKINGQYDMFLSHIGLFDSGHRQSRDIIFKDLKDYRGEEGNVTFQVFLDGKIAYDSGAMGWADKKEINIPISKINEIKLVVLPGESINSDIAIWGNAEVIGN